MVVTGILRPTEAERGNLCCSTFISPQIHRCGPQLLRPPFNRKWTLESDDTESTRTHKYTVVYFAVIRIFGKKGWWGTFVVIFCSVEQFDNVPRLHGTIVCPSLSLNGFYDLLFWLRYPVKCRTSSKPTTPLLFPTSLLINMRLNTTNRMLLFFINLK